MAAAGSRSAFAAAVVTVLAGAGSAFGQPSSPRAADATGVADAARPYSRRAATSRPAGGRYDPGRGRAGDGRADEPRQRCRADGGRQPWGGDHGESGRLMRRPRRAPRTTPPRPRVPDRFKPVNPRRPRVRTAGRAPRRRPRRARGGRAGVERRAEPFAGARAEPDDDTVEQHDASRRSAGDRGADAARQRRDRRDRGEPRREHHDQPVEQRIGRRDGYKFKLDDAGGAQVQVGGSGSGSVSVPTPAPKPAPFSGGGQTGVSGGAAGPGSGPGSVSLDQSPEHDRPDGWLGMDMELGLWNIEINLPPVPGWTAPDINLPPIPGWTPSD